MLLLGVVGAVVERRLETSPHAILGFFIGLGGVLLTLLLNAFALRVGGAEDWRPIVLLVFVAHLPIAILEGIIMAFTVSFLSRVKPDLLVGWQPVMDEAPAVRETVRQVPALHGSSHALKAPRPCASGPCSSYWPACSCRPARCGPIDSTPATLFFPTGASRSRAGSRRATRRPRPGCRCTTTATSC